VAVLPTFDMLLFGGTGDLVTRKLLPALYRRFVAGQVSADSRIVGIARGTLSRGEYLAQAETAGRGFLGKEFDAPHWTGFSALIDYVKIEADAPADYGQLAAVLEGREHFVRVFFFSTASNLFTLFCENLAKSGVVTHLSRVVLEKPLGHDTASADLINQQVGAVFTETQI
jgi:glucose-6-phosphate 1-dehydrogenase